MIRLRNINLLVSLWLALFVTISLEAAGYDITHTTQNGIHIWYPSSNQGGPYPLVVFSHGAAVGSPTNCPYLTQGLSRQGYVTCATKHTDNKQTRIQDVKKEIDEMLRLNNDHNSPLYGMIDENTIGVCGHSLGGWTAEAICGAAANGQNGDRRVKAGFFLEPANYSMSAQLGSGIFTPSMFIFGTKDILVPPATNKAVYDGAPAPKYCAIVSGLDHFTAAMGSSGLNAVTGEYALAFFNRYLKGDTSADTILQTKHSSFQSYEYDLGAGNASTDTTATNTEDSGTSPGQGSDTAGNGSGTAGNGDCALCNKSLADCPIVKALKQIQEKRQSNPGDSQTLAERIEEMKNTTQDQFQGKPAGGDIIQKLKDTTTIGNIFKDSETIFSDPSNNIFTIPESLSTSNLTNLSNNTSISAAKQNLPSLNLGSGSLLNSGLLKKSLGNLSTSGSGILSHLSSGNLSGIASFKQSLSSLNLGSGKLLGSGSLLQNIGNFSTLGSGMLR